MLELFNEINYLSVLIAAAVGFAIAGGWYSKLLFARAWMEENKFTEKDLAEPMPAMVKSFLSYLVLAFGIAVVFLMMKPIGSILAGSEMTALEGAKWGFFLAVLIHGAAGLPNYIYEKKTLTHFLIHISNSALGMAAMGAILAVMN
jgi:hypothetical protein